MTGRRNPRGISLLELLVTLSLISTLLVITAGWIHQSMRFSSIMQQRQEQHQGLLRLSRQLRDDVHHGQSIRIHSDKALVIQTHDDRQVIYTTDAQRVIRRTRSETKVESEDSFPLATGTQLAWDDSELPAWLTLDIDGVPLDNAALDDDTINGNPLGSGAAIHRLHLRIAVDRYSDRYSDVASQVAEQGDAP